MSNSNPLLHRPRKSVKEQPSWEKIDLPALDDEETHPFRETDSQLMRNVEDLILFYSHSSAERQAHQARLQQLHRSTSD